MSDLLALAERVEAASRPDRELDAAIVKALYPDAHVGIYIAGDEEPTVFHANPLVADKRTLPAFTGSIDAAMTLVSEQLRWCVDDIRDGKPRAFVEDLNDFSEDAVSHNGIAATPALALTAAALRARAASTPSLNAEIAGIKQGDSA